MWDTLALSLLKRVWKSVYERARVWKSVFSLFKEGFIGVMWDTLAHYLIWESVEKCIRESTYVEKCIRESASVSSFCEDL